MMVPKSTKAAVCKHTAAPESSGMVVVDAPQLEPPTPTASVETVSQLQRLPQELLQSVLQRVPRPDWAAVRLVNRCFDATLAPLITSITIRQWAPASSGNSSRVAVGSSSSLKHVQHLQAAVDSDTRQSGDLQQVLRLLAQLQSVRHLTLRGLKPLQGLAQILCPPAPTPGTGAVPRCRSSNASGSSSISTTAAAAVCEALAGLQTLELPDSSSSSLPAGLQLPHLTSITLFSVDSLPSLAAFAPNLQRVECFSLTITPGPPGGSQKLASGAAGVGGGSSGVLAACKTLAATCINTPSSSSVEAALGCLAHTMPGLQSLLALPHLEQPTEGAGTAQQPCGELTLRALQQALPGLQLVGAASAG